MSAATLKRRLLELERLDEPAGLLPIIVDDSVPDAVIEHMRRCQRREVMRLQDFVEECV